MFFSILFHTTADPACVEQMSQNIKFVEVKRNSIDVKEKIINKLKRCGLNFID